MRRRRPGIRTSLFIVAISLTLVAVAGSPWILQRVWRATEIDSQFASEIGQSYGGISALVSALALCVLAVSTVVQVRQTKLTQLHSARLFQLELMRMSFDDPALRLAFAHGGESLDASRWKARVYTNMWIRYLQMIYVTGEEPEAAIRQGLAEDFFKSPVGIDFWESTRKMYENEISSRGEERFFRIVDDEHKKATTDKDTRQDPTD